MIKLSVVITAYNEEKKIEDCLKSVKGMGWEIVVVDNQSSDKTADIAKKYTDNVYSQKNRPEGLDIQKNLGFEKATGEWILSLDADERITPKLGEEINNVIASNASIVAYWIPRKNIIFGKEMRHTGWYPDYQLRLFRKGMGKYTSQHVHEHIQIEGKTEKLTNPLMHYNFETVSQFLHKHMMLYAPSEAQNLIAKGYIFRWQDVIQMPANEFISRFFARDGYKDGFHGLILSLFMAFYHFVIFAYIWEQKKFIAVDEEDLLAHTEEEIKKVGKDMHYWYITEKIKKTKNSGEKVLLQIKRKLGT